MRPAGALRVLALTAPGSQTPTFKKRGQRPQGRGAPKNENDSAAGWPIKRARGRYLNGRDASLAAR
jgi:hypothetical protein